MNVVTYIIRNKFIQGLLFFTFGMGVAVADPTYWTEDFNGGVLDPAWNQLGTSSNHLGLSGTGYYEMTDHQTDPQTVLERVPGGTSGDFDASITLTMVQFLNPTQTQTDLRWRFGGVDGNLELRMNSFGAINLDHNNFGGSNSNIDSDTIAFSNGDELQFNVDYRDATQGIDVYYSLNGGLDVLLYSGGGADGLGTMGDIITFRNNLNLGQFADNANRPNVQIQEWNLTAAAAVPEPGTLGLFGVGMLLLMARRRVMRRQ